MNNKGIARLKFYRGQMLTARDFEDQQEYHRSKQKLLLRRFPAGIVGGLAVTCSAKGADPADFDGFLIGEGLAVDSDGNELVVPEGGLKEPTTNFNPETPYLSLYSEEGEELVGGDACGGSQKNNRITEGVKVKWQATPNIDPYVTVAYIQLKNPKEPGTTCDKFRDPMNPEVKIGDPPVRKNARVVDTEQITDGAVTDKKIKNAAVTADKLAPNSVGSDKIAANAVSAGKIAPNAVNMDAIQSEAVTDAKLAPNAVVAGKIAPDAVQRNAIQNEAVNGAKLAPNAVDAGKIAPNAVQRDAIQGEAITADKLAPNAVVLGKVATDAIHSEAIRAAAVTPAKLAPNAVEAGKIATNAVQRDAIQNEAVSADKLAPNAVTSGKINTNAVQRDAIQNDAINSDKIAPNAVTSGKINTNAVQRDAIQNGAVTDVKLAANAVVAGKVATNAVQRDAIQNGAVNADKIDNGAVSSGKLNLITTLPSNPVTIASGGTTSHKLLGVSQNAVLQVFPTASEGELSWTFRVKKGATAGTFDYTLLITNTGTVTTMFEVRQILFN